MVFASTDRREAGEEGRGVFNKRPEDNAWWAGGDDDNIIRATDDLTTRINMVEFLDLSHPSHPAFPDLQ